MALVAATNLSKNFGAEQIFSGLSFQIGNHARIGLVGPNGVGKTTLLRLITAEDEEHGGKIHISRGLRIGYLPQLSAYESERTLWGECLQVFRHLIAMQRELRALEAILEQNADDEQSLAVYSQHQNAFEHAGGYLYETKIHQTLAGLGFAREDESRPWQQLSGGQRTRAMLARLLLEEPDLLLLDEPTNHLDIASVEWLEGYLKGWQGALLIVSHDRYFLDQVAETIWEMDSGLGQYKGNYSAYLQQRIERQARKLAEYESQQEFVEKEEEYIRRNIAGQNTRQAQGRRKRLNRLLAESTPSQPRAIHQHRQMRIQLEPSARSGNLVLQTHQLQVGYVDEGRPLFTAPDLVLERKECAAILGPNGAGKTTFLKTILKQIAPYAGKVELGAGLKIGYFAQTHDDLRAEQTLMQVIESAAPQMLPGQIRDYLAKFLFSGDDVFKAVALLSGGERGRLALAVLGLQGANLLLLDEPTNHLDLASQDILQGILADFEGTILLVSHDRYLIDALATQIWELNVNSNQLDIFTGSYSQFREFKDLQKSGAINQFAPSQEQPDKTSSWKTRFVAGLSKNERLRLQKNLDELEEQISILEDEMHGVEEQLQQPLNAIDGIEALGQRHQTLQLLLSEHMAAWEELATKLAR